MVTATPTKLRSGEWGARVQGVARQGDTIKITTRAGKSWEATVSKVVWSGDDVSIVATSSDRGSSRGRTWAKKGGWAKSCPTGGNCSSFGSGRSCGSPDCDGY